MVLGGAGVGVDHDELVKLASQHFSAQPIWAGIEGLSGDKKPGRDLSLSQYTGGKIEVSRDSGGS